jgi:hypothetical protein
VKAPGAVAEALALSNHRASVAQIELTGGRPMRAFNITHMPVVTGIAGPEEDSVHRMACVSLKSSSDSTERATGTQCLIALELRRRPAK